MVRDIELVAIPKQLPDLFGGPSGITLIDTIIRGTPALRKESGGGQRLQKLTYFTRGQIPWEIPVDLFLQPDPATWGVNFLLRTGPEEFSHLMATKRQWDGLMPAEYTMRDARIWKEGQLEPLNTPEEEDIFRLWKIPFIEAKDRARYMWRLLEGRNK